MLKRLILLPLALVALGATNSAEPFELVRQGNAAFANQDFTRALQLYEQAASRITDPGLVAFNQAAALYRLGRFREAELHYRRSLEDAVGARRGRMLYDLGNCLLHQSAGTDPQLLEQAVECYRQAQELADDNLAGDLRHNLELTKLLWLKARANRQREPSSPDAKKEAKKEAKPLQKVEIGKPENGPHQKLQPASKTAVNPQEVKGPPQLTDQPSPPGSNESLQPIPDKDEPVTLSAEDARRRLKHEAQQIRGERLEHLKRSAPLPPRGVMDW